MTVALWGLSFKPNTDDMREAPSLTIIRELLEAGARVRAYDPVAMDEARKALAGVAGADKAVVFVDEAYAAATGADVLAVATEWQEFRSPDFDRLRSLLTQPVIFDGRNIYNPELLKRLGLQYYGIGRGLAA
jgi:UDPglucose 6-dehydrogenase